MPSIVPTPLLSSSPRTAAAAAVAAAQLLEQYGADNVAKPPRTDVAGWVVSTAA